MLLTVTALIILLILVLKDQTTRVCFKLAFLLSSPFSYSLSTNCRIMAYAALRS